MIHTISTGRITLERLKEIIDNSIDEFKMNAGKRIEIDSLLPLHTLRDICAAVEVDLFFFCTCQDIGENLRIVNDRICIGHQYDTCVSAARRSQ